MLRGLIVIIILILNKQVFSQAECLISDGYATDLKLDNDIKLTDAVILGEFHGVLGTSEIKWELIKRINQQYSFKDIFMEISTSTAYLYNLFLATGDTTLLTAPRLPYYIKTPEKLFWRNMYQYNSVLPDSLKIKIYGVDFERMEFLKVLKILIMPGYTTRNSPFIKKLFNEYDSLMNNIREYADGFEDVFSDYKKEFYKNYDNLKQVYGPNLPYAENIFLNKSSAKEYSDRDRSMFNNFIEIIRKNNIQKFVGFFGLNHTNSRSGNTFIQRLINSGKYKNVVNISMVCKNCIDWLQRVKYAAYAGPYTYQGDKTLMESIYKNYYLDSCKFTIIPTNIIKNKEVRSFSSYLILLKDQPEFD